MPHLELKGVNTFYGEAQALHDIDLHVGDGEIVAVIGANGAGKTTLLKTISGLVRPYTGSIHYDGRDITRRPAWDMTVAGIAHIPEGRRLFAEMSIEENLMMGAYRRRDRAGIAQDLARVYALFPQIADRRGQLAGTLSGGEQQMTAIGRALMTRPRLLLLDEPSLGLAPKIVGAVFDTIRSINGDGTAIVLVEQNAQLALETAQRAYLMESGRMVRSGPADALIADDGVREAYLGL